MSAIAWSNLIRPREDNWPCAATGCSGIAEVAVTVDGWRYGLCRADAERHPTFDPALLDAQTDGPSSEPAPLATP